MELLVVIAIIAILATILVPSLSSSRERGRIAYCANNLSQLGKGLMMYLDVNGGKFPAATTDGSSSTWDTAILPHVGDARELFACPSDPYRNDVVTNEYSRTYSANGAAAGSVPFGNETGQGMLRMSDLDYHKGDIILLGECLGTSAADHGKMGQYSYCTLKLNDARSGIVHSGESGGNYLLGSLSVRYIRKNDPALQVTSGENNIWQLFTGQP